MNLIVTTAQNNTRVHKGLLKNIESYAKFINAKIIVIPIRYKNPTSIHINRKEEAWDNSILPYVSWEDKIFGKVLVAGNVRIQPSAVNPLSGMIPYSRGYNMILGHPKQHLEIVMGGDKEGNIICTSGAITKHNYTDSKAGVKGLFNHIMGFVVVENVNDPIIRQVSAKDDGSFIDLFYQVKDGKITKSTSECMVLGDIHITSVNEPILKEFMSIGDKMEIKKYVLHDLFDGRSVNYHADGNIIEEYIRKTDYGLLDEELQITKERLYKYFGTRTNTGHYKYEVIVVKSNHDEWLEKFIMNPSRLLMISNYKTFLDMSLNYIRDKGNKPILSYYIKQKNVKFLKRKDLYRIKGWLVSYHGDISYNGKGSIAQFRKMNTKIIIGHRHTPTRKDGVICVGITCEKEQPYVKVYNTWKYASAVIHKNGKAQLLIANNQNKITYLKL